MDPIDPFRVVDESEDPFPIPSTSYCLLEGNGDNSVDDVPLDFDNVCLQETNQVHCLICGDSFSHLLIKNEIVDRSYPGHSFTSANHRWTEDESNIFQWLLKNFQLKISKKQLWHTEQDAFPICVSCKFELQCLVDLQIKLEQISQALRNGMKKLKEKMGAKEEVFTNSKIYQNDVRYAKFRSQIIQKSKNNLKPSVRSLPIVSKRAGKNVCSDFDSDPLLIDADSSPVSPVLSTSPPWTPTAKTTRSGRKLKPVSRFSSSQVNARYSSPVVLLSADDKSKADKRRHQNETEVDPLQIDDDKFTHSIPTTTVPGTSNVKKKSPTRKKRVKKARDDVLFSVSCDDTDFDKAFEDDEDSDSEIKTRRKLKTKAKNVMEDDFDSDPDFTINEDDGNSVSVSSDENDECFEGEVFENLLSNLGEDPFKNEQLTFDPQTNTAIFKDVVFFKTDNDQFKCDKCSEIFPKGCRRIKLRHHVIRKHLNDLRCKICKWAFTTFSQYKSHIKSKHSGPRSKALKTKTTKPKRKPYTKVAEGELICPICAKPTRSRYSLEVHRWTHCSQEEKEEIKARGDLPQALKAHLRSFQCDECGGNFKYKTGLNRHKKFAHYAPEEEKNVVENPHKELCAHCGKSYAELKIHVMRAHAKELGIVKEYPCGICGRIFYHSRARRVHKMEFHNQLSPYVCNQCPKPRGFASKFKYNQHMNSHLGIRPYQCDKCPSAFTIKNHLIRHNKVYHEEGGNPRRNAYIRGRTKKIEKSKRNPNDSVPKEELSSSSSNAMPLPRSLPNDVPGNPHQHFEVSYAMPPN